MLWCWEEKTFLKFLLSQYLRKDYYAYTLGFWNFFKASTLMAHQEKKEEMVNSTVKSFSLQYLLMEPSSI